MKKKDITPLESLERVKLMMGYDTSKTLTENKETISEQYVAPAVAGGVTGAALGAGAAKAGLVAGTLTGGGVAGAATSLGLALGATGTAAATLGFAVLGGVAAAAVVPLAYWLITKDTGSNKVKKIFELCSTESSKIARLERKLSDGDIRAIADDIEDAINHQTWGFMAGTDEEKLFSAFKKVSDGTASDFCKLVDYYNKNSSSGDLFDDLDSDIDAESEWTQIYRPIRNCVEDSLLKLKDEDVEEDCIKNPNQPKCKGTTPTKLKYVECKGPVFKYLCYNRQWIWKMQGCIGAKQDGYFGPETLAKLKLKNGYNNFNENSEISADQINKLCGGGNTPPPPPPPVPEPDLDDVTPVDPEELNTTEFSDGNEIIMNY